VSVLTERSNAQWLSDLRESGPQRELALEELRARLIRGLGYALADQPNVRTDDIEDFAQDALLRILSNLDSFRGEAQFTTWAQKIAVRVALSALRRRRWRDVSLDGIIEAGEGDFVPELLSDPAATPEEQAIRRKQLDVLRRIINEELTDKQRQALVAVRVQGMPMDEVAERLGTNRNALYKLLFDARQRLKARLVAQGLSPAEMLAGFAD
jgi:RNA polymerase sigma-70 factor (ECF subfamily)